jgi:hypothetical protein
MRDFLLGLIVAIAIFLYVRHEVRIGNITGKVADAVNDTEDLLGGCGCNSNHATRGVVSPGSTSVSNAPFYGKPVAVPSSKKGQSYTPKSVPSAPAPLIRDFVATQSHA